MINPDNNDRKVGFYKWQTNDFRRMERVMVNNNVLQIFEDLKCILPNFVVHQRIKNVQHNAYNKIKTDCSHSQILFQFDFAENFNCLFQDEIMAAHWNNQMVTLFTCCIWNGNSVPVHCVVVSDVLDHNKIQIAAYILKIFEIYVTDSVTINFFSDGPASQFKNRYMLSLIQLLSTTFKLANINWNFFATAHGKGPVDGLGGRCKRIAYSEIMARQCIVNNAETFINAVRKRDKITDLILMNQHDIDDINLRYGVEDVFKSSVKVIIFIQKKSANKYLFI
jgi:hypothetical protein